MRILTLFASLLALSHSAFSLKNEFKINPNLLAALKAQNNTNIFVKFESTAGILKALATTVEGLSHGERATKVYEALKNYADNSQKSALKLIQNLNHSPSKVQSFWITNQLYIQNADVALINALTEIDAVEGITQEIIVAHQPLFEFSPHPNPSGSWGVFKIQADKAWTLGATGEGIVVGIIDSGVRHTHEALKESFRGGEHSWFDPYGFSESPHDNHGHGTHVAGTIVGKLGIGVAPKAKFISCKGLEAYGTESALIACGQFILCPHNYLGNFRNCSMAPSIVSNSWGSVIPGDTFYDAVIMAWHTANILPVFAAGNAGPRCESIGSPTDSRAKVLAVAATDSDDKIAFFSSRGPSTHAEKFIPDVAAPGVNILSAAIFDDNAYALNSGTSMAAPHVSGLAALVMSKNPSVSYEELRNIISSTAARKLTFGDSKCGGIPESDFPNYSFGNGRVDALEAIMSLLK